MVGLKEASNRLETYLSKNKVKHPDDAQVEDIPDDEDEEVRRIDKQALEDDYLSGRWITYLRSERVDGVWKELNRLIEKDLVWGAKVTTDWLRDQRDAEEFTLMVYTPNYLDKGDVFRVRDLLKNECEVDDDLVYKPDIYGVLQIYTEDDGNFKLPKEERYRG